MDDLKLLDKENSALLLKIDLLEENIIVKDKLLNEKDNDYSELLLKVKDLENDLKSKSELLVANDRKYTELLQHSEDIEKNLISFGNEERAKMHKQIEVLNENLKAKSELLRNKDSEIFRIQNILEKTEIDVEKLQYEIFEMSEKLRSERQSIKVCLDCESLKEKEEETEKLKEKLQETENQLAAQKFQKMEFSRMLQHAEESHNQRRKMNEAEINECKANIFRLEEELRLKRYQEMIAKKPENVNLNQNAKEITNSKNEITVKQPVNQNAEQKQNEAITIKKETMSSQLDLKTVQQNRIEIANIKKVTNDKTDFKKRKWETDSSGSECFELVVDKDSTVKKILTPRRKPSTNLKNFTPRNEPNMKDIYHTSKDNEVPCRGKIPMKKIRASPRLSPVIAKKEVLQRDFDDFINSKGNPKKEINKSNLTSKDVTPKMSTPPKEKKFFKTPQKYRESILKKSRF